MDCNIYGHPSAGISNVETLSVPSAGSRGMRISKPPSNWPPKWNGRRLGTLRVYRPGGRARPSAVDRPSEGLRLRPRSQGRPHRNAPMYTLGVFEGSTGEVKEPLEMTEAGAFLPRPASLGIHSSEWSLPGLNWGPSDFQSLEPAANTPENHGILNFQRAGRTAGRTGEQSEGGTPDAELASIIVAWPTLPEPIKAAIRALLGSAKGS